MIRKYKEMPTIEKEQLRGGSGSTKFVSLAEEGSVKHCRLFSEITLEKGCSIGEHDHVNETEYYWITEGEGIVTEIDGEKKVTKGDLVVTGGGASHAIRNEQEAPLKFAAIIILD
jgi:mannose-6-phosphate isomerase-like protein (cupin superfamily)